MPRKSQKLEKIQCLSRNWEKALKKRVKKKFRQTEYGYKP